MHTCTDAYMHVIHTHIRMYVAACIHIIMCVCVAITDYDSIETLKSFLHESNIMKKFDHPNVLSIFGVCLENDHDAGVPFIVLPFMANGDLKSYLKDHRTKSESVNQLPEVQL